MSLKKVNFGKAKWIGAGLKNCPIHIYKTLTVNGDDTANILIGCFGTFILNINGKRVGEDCFLPHNTDFEERNINYGAKPFNEQLGHRLYCPRIDITEYLAEGENEIEFMLGSGFYELYDYGVAKLCFLIELTDKAGVKRFVYSSGNEVYTKSFVTESNMVYGEKQNFVDFDTANLQTVMAYPSPKTDMYLDVFPTDKIIRKIIPKHLKNGIYDVGENISGVVVLRSDKAGEVKLRYGELLDQNGGLLKSNVFGQHTEFITDNKERFLSSQFTWHTFRYFEVIGEAEVVECDVIHSDVDVTSYFTCDNEILNWLYTSYLRTQLDNMHCGVPSDCPHVERRGYTGDGQLTCGAAMMQFDSKDFYKKWIYDIFDCQDKTSGHVQYTAPFVPSGGGPGGWGCAVVVVPYEYYKNYGDKTLLQEAYPKMLKWFEFMENHSEEDIVVSDIEGVWCLGDWCAPAQDELNKMDGMRIPVPFVNTYFYIKSMEIFLKVSAFLGKCQTEEIKCRIDRKKKALCDKYFNLENGNFANNEQGANAFAIDLGIGDKRTFDNIVKHYLETKQFDTGIFGTDIVTRVLFENGRSDVAIMLLTSKEKTSYYTQMVSGDTTLCEYWNGVRSHCHPMFGATTRYIFEYILGIRQTENSHSFESVIIEPKCMSLIKAAKGRIRTKSGDISVEYDSCEIKIALPKGVIATLKLSNRTETLSQGKNTFSLN